MLKYEALEKADEMIMSFALPKHATNVHLHVHMHIYVYICMLICIYTYMYTYVYMHIFLRALWLKRVPCLLKRALYNVDLWRYMAL